ncbi:MAG: rhodanese-like domain-containing protein [Archangium sp.]|nr:rhodanese-like domain-containing protein [Archangium sp.]
MLLLSLCALVVSADGGVVEISPRDFYRRALVAPVAVATAEQVRAWQKEKAVVVVDLRSKEQFAKQHLAGAINIPATELTDEVVRKLLPDRSARVVAYCDDQLMPTRRIALTTLGVPSLRELGYSRVLVLENLWSRRDAKAGAPAARPGGLSFEGSGPARE